MTLTICYYTSRTHPEIQWFFDSLKRQQKPDDDVRIVIVDAFADNDERRVQFRSLAHQEIIHVLPKPNVWQGTHRLTKEDWWAISNARNTGICYAPDGWISWVDDRSVLVETWFKAVREAMLGGYAVAGSYEKRHGMVVKDGQIVEHGSVTGKDPRFGNVRRPVVAPGTYWYGGTSSLPVEWALAVNGVDETCDSLGLEDNIFGLMLYNNGYPIMYDKRMKVIEDRTPGHAQESSMFKRTDKGVSPNDKSHALLHKLEGLKRAIHPLDLREIRRKNLAGEPFPIPTEPSMDWYDQQPLSEF